jgi:hypothetical protein
MRRRAAWNWSGESTPAGRDVELGEAAADPYQGALAGVQVVVHLSVGGLAGEDFVAVEVAGVETGSGSDFDGVEAGEPGRSLVAYLCAGTEEGALGLVGAKQGGDGLTCRFGLGLDGGDEEGGIDGGRLAAAVAAGKTVFNLLVGRADHGHPSHGPAHPPRSSARSSHLG